LVFSSGRSEEEVLAMAEDKKAFESVMDETRIFEPPIALSRKAHVRSLDEYEEIYKRSIEETPRDSGQKRLNSWNGSKNGSMFWRLTSPKPPFVGLRAGN
jgi:hypothetical protein